MNKVHQLDSKPTGPLASIRIVDMTGVVFGPYATQMLADLGADVIKVEGPARGEHGEGGDTMRYGGSSPGAGLGPIFMALNRNKRSVMLDLAKPEDRAALDGLIATADIFLSNVRMKALERLKLSYADVAAITPDIIYAHASGYDSQGPDADLPAYDDLIQARSGMADLLRRVGQDDRPQYLPSLIADKVSGLFLVQAVLAALYHRKSTGEGQFLEVPMLEAMTSFTLVEHFYDQIFDPPTGDWGYQRVLSEHRQPYPTKDGYIAMLPYSTEQWERVFTFFGRPGGIVDDPKFATFAGRLKNIDELYALLVENTANRTTDEWMEHLTLLKVPHAKVQRLEDLQDDEQFQSVSLFQRFEHPEAGGYVAMRSPIKFSKTPTNIYRHPPSLGRDTADILDEIGVGAAEAAQ